VTAQAPDQRIRSELRRDAVSLPGIVMQGVATIAPAFAILASFVFTVSVAGLASPIAYGLAGVGMLLVAISVSQLAKAFPSAGGWYTWIARALHPRIGFLAGWIFSIWLPPVGVLVFSFFAKTVLEPALEQEYGWTVPWWTVVVVGLALVAWSVYAGISISEKLLIATGLLEICIMVALALTGFANPGPGGFSFAPLNPANAPGGSGLFTAIVFSIFAFSGWEAVAPLAEESRNPRRNVPIGLIASVIILSLYFLVAVWGYLVGIGVDQAGSIPEAAAFPVFTLATKVWGGAWVLVLFALLNSVIAVSIACFNGGTRTWYAMGRSGTLPAWFAQVSPTRRTPDNAIHFQVGIQVVGFVLILIFGVENVFFTWALTITLGLILMYVLANAGVVRQYLGESRAELNPFLHIVLPVVSAVAVAYVAYRSLQGLAAPVSYAPWVFGIYMLLGIGVLAYLRVSGREAFLEKARLAMEEADEIGPHETDVPARVTDRGRAGRPPETHA
jgi:amino acid transporter